MALTEEQIRILRDKRETVNGRRAHYLCNTCGCTISSDLELCANCDAETGVTPYGTAILEYKRTARREKYKLK